MSTHYVQVTLAATSDESWDWLLENLVCDGTLYLDRFFTVPEHCPEHLERILRLHQLGTWGFYKDIDLDFTAQTITMWCEVYPPIKLFQSLGKTMPEGMRVLATYDQFNEDNSEMAIRQGIIASDAEDGFAPDETDIETVFVRTE